MLVLSIASAGGIHFLKCSMVSVDVGHLLGISNPSVMQTQMLARLPAGAYFKRSTTGDTTPTPRNSKFSFKSTLLFARAISGPICILQFDVII